MAETPTPRDPSIHGKWIRQRLPGWLRHVTPEDIKALGRARHPGQLPGEQTPPWLASAAAPLRQALRESQARSRAANDALAKTLAGFKGIAEFGEPLLKQALSDTFSLDLDVKRYQLFHLRYRQPIRQQSLLQAALTNFEADEAFDEESLQQTSALAPKGALITEYYGEPRSDGSRAARYLYREKLAIPPLQFATACRQLDLGQRYQDHISAVFDAPDNAARVRQQMIQAQRDTFEVRLHIARIKDEIGQSAYDALLAVLAGDDNVMLHGKPLVYSQLEVLGVELGEVLVFSTQGRRTRHLLDKAEPYSALLPANTIPLVKFFLPAVEERVVVFIPGAPLYPLKEYDSLAAFEKDLLINLRSPVYQRLFTGFVKQDDLALFHARLNEQLRTFKWNPDAGRHGRMEEVYNDEARLNIDESFVDGDVFGIWYERHLARLKANARLIAIPTAQVDSDALWERLKHYAERGLDLLNLAAFFVPGLGEVMMAVTAVQLALEVYHGLHAWEQGYRDEAWGHLESVAVNMAFMAALAGAGALAAKTPKIQVSRWVDGLVPVKLPSGEARLWRPDLGPYRSDVVLAPNSKPNALGQYVIDGKHYIRIENDLYEKTFDPTLKQWRIRHPQDATAYQPVLEHNQAGAWRHVHERPLEWNRLTLLRRLGPDTAAFSDETLSAIGEISGVHDDVLRKVHVDRLPIPAALADTLEQFRLDQQVDDVIGQIRDGVGFPPHYECVAPLTVEMPRWPEGRVLEVFQGPEPWGASARYGSPSSPADVRATIKITRDELYSGQLAERVLAVLSDAEVTQLLGSEDGWLGQSREQVFNERMADHALTRKKALFDSLSRSAQPPVADVGVLPRRFPGLSWRAQGEVLDSVGVRERSQLHTTGRVPAKLDDLARIAVQQGRLNRAIAGLHRENLASVDSDRLALHSLQHLPGWPENLRLEVRADTVGGALLDSIGDASAAVRKYLVKAGDTFQAHDERGEALGSVPAHGRNFYQSIMHALPDGARQALDIPQVSQDASLQQALAGYALSHRSEMAAILKQRVPRSRPSIRLPGGQLGYELTGRGDAFREDAPLIARVRELYPNISEQEAHWFVLMQRGNGQSAQQIYHLLANRQRELDHLRATLQPWSASSEARRETADSIIHCWRQGLYRGGAPATSLDLWEHQGLPSLEADFSHVRALTLQGTALFGEQGAGLLRQFPGVRRLNLQVERSDLAGVAERLAGLSDITELSINGPHLRYTQADLQRITGMEQLQRLSLNGNMDSLNISGLKNLRRLTVNGSLAVWPEGLPETLEYLNLSATQVRALPTYLSSGFHPLWRGLHMNWSGIEPETFMTIYEGLHGNTSHLVDTDRLVRAYCESNLGQLRSGDSAFIARVLDEFRVRGLSAREQLQRVNDVRVELRTLTQSLTQWAAREVTVGRTPVDVAYRQRVAERVLACWRNGLDARLASGSRPGPSRATDPSPVRLDLSGGALGDLPELPDAGFAHVSNLDLGGIQVPLEELNAFLGRFAQVQQLSLNSNNLRDLPAALTGFTSLRVLDFSHNMLSMTPVIQARLDTLTHLTALELQYNPIGTLDVGRLNRLLSLDLSHTAIRTWPAGVLQRPPLGRLDLSHSGITTVPEQAFNGNDVLMSNTRLRGCRLTRATLVDIQAYSQHLYRRNPMGLPEAQMPTLGTALYLSEPLGIRRALLAEGRTGGDPEYFPENVAQNPELLVPLPLAPEGQQAQLTASARLQRLDPTLEVAQAVARIDDLRSSGLGALDLEARLAEWERQQRHWVTVLNEWIDIPAQRQGSRWLSALDRRRAADRLLRSWRSTLRAASQASAAEEGGQVLDLSGLILGDLPAVPSVFEHVTELNLTGVQLTEQGSNAFLRAFTQVQALVLDRNDLITLPDAVDGYQHLTRLQAAGNDLRDAAALSARLQRWPALERLDLSNNLLGELDVTGMPRLETLNLSSNMLADWPTGVLELPRLRTLNLRNNQIETIPDTALETRYRPLMAHTDLSDNLLLEQTFETLRDYLARTGNGLGFSDEEIDQLIRGYHLSEDEAALGPEQHPEIETWQTQKARWFTDVAANSQRHRVWDELCDAEGSRDFFFCLSQLRYTRDFAQNLNDLTQRVWQVLDAVHGDAQLRRDIFARATAVLPDITCGDGRILVFNELETSVYEFNALQAVTPQQQGAGLLRLARGMIRLEEVEAIASESIRNRSGIIDPAEIRLAYRIGLAQRLQLPRQPSGMLYANLARVTPADLDAAYDRVIASESTEGFQVKLVNRQYWLDYLKKKYAQQFANLKDQQQLQVEALEERHGQLTPQYFAEIEALGRRHKGEQTALEIRLSSEEYQQLGG